MAGKVGLDIGDLAPELCLVNQDKEETCLKNLPGKWIILYFYPKDMTPGCTTEAIDFSTEKHSLTKLNAVILGVSPDSADRHCKFIAKHDLKITLLSDPEKEALQEFGVWQKKKMAGKEFWGVVRSTFLIDPEGVIRDKWTNVKVKGHVEAVKASLEKLSG
ncbi:peroxiredoxin [candidate division CSSED10-310 bacterium]|uniref:thioredoxin-dependent peroxiredoxin n=1 Tax=candidate division CSSED10-310 bacterium TaxID=2855610 RepID=A0ABV6Z1V0_UNCC1